MANRLVELERTCPICGKLFYPAPYHIYYDKSKNYPNVQSRISVCSYSCMRNSEKKDKRAYRKRSGY